MGKARNNPLTSIVKVVGADENVVPGIFIASGERVEKYFIGGGDDPDYTVLTNKRLIVRTGGPQKEDEPKMQMACFPWSALTSWTVNEYSDNSSTLLELRLGDTAVWIMVRESDILDLFVDVIMQHV